eukprot:m.1225363 g.1225363  ORF g.1225363 m.1225363 type:complete len:1912 (+) comp24631_c0_seq3:363-6098(+)
MTDAVLLRSPIRNVTALAPQSQVGAHSNDDIKRFLRENSIASKKLSLPDILPVIGFRHAKGFINKIERFVEAHYGLELFDQLPLPDGSIYNVALDIDGARTYEKRLQAALVPLRQKLHELTRGSRKGFGVLTEKRVIVVLDLSGVTAASCRAYRQAVNAFLSEQLSAVTERFNIIRSEPFITSCLFDGNGTEETTPRTIAAAEQWINALQPFTGIADDGVPDTLDALQVALGDPSADAVLLVTDGNREATARVLQSRGIHGGKRLHTVALGSAHMGAPTVSLLKTLARATGGSFHVYDGDLDDIADDTGVHRTACDNADVHAVRAAVGVAAGTLALVRALITEHDARRRIPSVSSSLRRTRHGTPREHKVDAGGSDDDDLSDSDDDGATPTQRWLAHNSASALRLRLADMLPAARFPDVCPPAAVDGNTLEVAAPTMTPSATPGPDKAPQEGNESVRGTVQLAGQTRAVWRQAGVPQYVWPNGAVSQVFLTEAVFKTYCARADTALNRYQHRVLRLRAGVRAITGGAANGITSPVVTVVLAGGPVLRHAWCNGTLGVLVRTLLDRHVMGQRSFNVATTWGAAPDEDSGGLAGGADGATLPVGAVPWAAAPVEATVNRCDDACAWLTRAAAAAVPPDKPDTPPCAFAASICGAIGRARTSDVHAEARKDAALLPAASVLLLCDASAVPTTAHGRKAALETVSALFAADNHNVAQLIVTSVDCADHDTNDFLHNLATCVSSASEPKQQRAVTAAFNYYGADTHGWAPYSASVGPAPLGIPTCNGAPDVTVGSCALLDDVAAVHAQIRVVTEARAALVALWQDTCRCVEAERSAQPPLGTSVAPRPRHTVAPRTPSAAELRQRRALTEDRRPDWEKYSRPEDSITKSSQSSRFTTSAPRSSIRSTGKRKAQQGTAPAPTSGAGATEREAHPEASTTPSVPPPGIDDGGADSTNGSVPPTSAEDKAIYRRILSGEAHDVSSSASHEGDDVTPGAPPRARLATDDRGTTTPERRAPTAQALATATPGRAMAASLAFAVDSTSADDATWAQPEAAQPKHSGPPVAAGEDIPLRVVQPTHQWLREFSIAAQKLTLRDSLDQTAVHVKGKYVRALKKTVYPKVFDEAYSYFYRLHPNGTRDGVKVYVFPEAARLKDYLVRLEQLLGVYRDRLVALVGTGGRCRAALVESAPDLATVDIHPGNVDALVVERAAANGATDDVELMCAEMRHAEGVLDQFARLLVEIQHGPAELPTLTHAGRGTDDARNGSMSPAPTPSVVLPTTGTRRTPSPMTLQKTAEQDPSSPPTMLSGTKQHKSATTKRSQRILDHVARIGALNIGGNAPSPYAMQHGNPRQRRRHSKQPIAPHPGSHPRNASVAPSQVQQGCRVLARVGQSPLYHLGTVATVVPGPAHAAHRKASPQMFVVSFGRHGQARVDPGDVIALPKGPDQLPTVLVGDHALVPGGWNNTGEYVLGEIVTARGDGTVVAHCATGVTVTASRAKVLVLSKNQRAHVQRVWDAFWPNTDGSARSSPTTSLDAAYTHCGSDVDENTPVLHVANTSTAEQVSSSETRERSKELRQEPLPRVLHCWEDDGWFYPARLETPSGGRDSDTCGILHDDGSRETVSSSTVIAIPPVPEPLEVGDVVLAPHVLLRQSFAPGTVTAVHDGGSEVRVQFYDGIAGAVPVGPTPHPAPGGSGSGTRNTDAGLAAHPGPAQTDTCPAPVRIRAEIHTAIVQRILRLEDALVGARVLCRDDGDGRFYRSTVRAHPRAGAWYVVEKDVDDDERPESEKLPGAAAGHGRQIPQLRSHLFTLANQVEALVEGEGVLACFSCDEQSSACTSFEPATFVKYTGEDAAGRKRCVVSTWQGDSKVCRDIARNLTWCGTEYYEFAVAYMQGLAATYARRRSDDDVTQQPSPPGAP